MQKIFLVILGCAVIVLSGLLYNDLREKERLKGELESTNAALNAVQKELEYTQNVAALANATISDLSKTLTEERNSYVEKLETLEEMRETSAVVDDWCALPLPPELMCIINGSDARVDDTGLPANDVRNSGNR